MMNKLVVELTFAAGLLSDLKDGGATGAFKVFNPHLTAMSSEQGTYLRHGCQGW